MNQLSIYTLKALRKIYTKVFRVQPLQKQACEQDPDVVSRIIYEKLMDDKPCMIARFGSNELLCMVTYLGIKEANHNIIDYITGKSKEWWWNETNLDNMFYVAGFYPKQYASFEKFCELMIKDVKEVDVLGSWLANERYFEKELVDCSKVHLRLLEPFWPKEPWTKALSGKKVLVIHPFSETILIQYEKRNQLFKHKDILPAFKSLTVIKAVQSSGQSNDQYFDWFDALDSMKLQIDKADFDICLIGAGAYGFPLAAYVKRMGKKAVHIGGALQLLFGIRGKRWEEPTYGVKVWGIPYGFYPALMNEHWVRPLNTEKPETANGVEGACYW